MVICPRDLLLARHRPRDQEDHMAKGQMKSNKEKKKPKSDDGKVKAVSAYKAQQGSGKK
jgi:hypothetical protein